MSHGLMPGMPASSGGVGSVCSGVGGANHGGVQTVVGPKNGAAGANKEQIPQASKRHASLVQGEPNKGCLMH